MASLNVQINGVERRAYARYRTLRIHKDHAVETCRIEFIDLDSTASAFRVSPGDTLRVDRDGTALEFGGEVTRVEDKRIGESDIGTVTVVEARGWYFEAESVVIPLLVVPAQDAYITIEALRATYLAPKGWTNVTPTSGGTVLPALVYENRTIASIYDDLASRLGEPWRVNGDKQMAFVPIGTLLAPVAYNDTNATVLRGATWSQERVRSASRIMITTGGSGEHLPHSETYTADGVKTHFPVNVLPPAIPARIANAAGYSSGASSLVMTGLPTSATLRSGSSLRFPTHLGYTLSAGVATDGNGDVIVPITPGLAAAVVDGEVGIFGPETFVSAEVGGTPVALDGAPWSYDAEQAIVYSNSAAPNSPVTYRSRINLPAVVRTWTAAAQDASGAFDYGEVRDASVSWPTLADVGAAKAQGDVELSYRADEPKTLRLATYQQDVYPWMLATCSFPDRLISGDWLIQSVTLTDTGRLSQLPRVEIVLLEGSTIGRNWRDFWRAPASSGGSGAATVIGSVGSTGHSGAGWIYLGGNRRDADDSSSWAEIVDAVPVRLGSLALAGTWTLRVYRSVSDSGTQVEVRLRDRTNNVTLASIAATNATTPTVGTASFVMPTLEGICLLEYRITAGSGSAIVENCSLEGY